MTEHPLPEILLKSVDVRWAGHESVFVASYRTGVFRIELAEPARPPALEVSRGNGLDGIWMPVHLASSEEYLAVGAPVFALAWKRRGEKALAAQVAFAAVVDIDLAEDRLLILGAQTDDEGSFAPDGAIAWVGPLSEDLGKLRTVTYSTEGAGARPLNACGLMDVGNVRFLPDGTFVVIPGVEPGVMLYDSGGKLLRSWQTEALGIDAGCDLSEEEMYRMSRDEPARWAWVNERRTVDDILPLAEGPGLLVRTRGPQETTWRLDVLDRVSGGVTSCPVPISSPSGLTQLHGDVAGDRVVFLLWGRGTKTTPGKLYVNPNAPPRVPPRLFTAKLQQ